MGPLPAALLAALSAAAVRPAWGDAPAEACIAQWKAEVHEAVWELKREEWGTLCAKHKSAPTALAEAKKAFVEDCLEKALPAIQAGWYTAESAKKLCETGVPGRDSMVKEQPIARPDTPQRKSGRVQGAAATTEALGSFVTDALTGGGPAALYGERQGAAGPLVVADPVRGAGTPALSGDVRDFHLRPQTRPPLLLDPVTQRGLDVAVIQSRVVADGVSKEAAGRAREVLGEMLSEADPAVVRNLVERKVHTYLIPKDKKMTDLAPFAALRGKKTFDGRLWDNVRGSGNTELPSGGGYAIAVAEETLLVDEKPGNGYPRNFVLVHEFGHSVQIHGLPTMPDDGPGPRRGLFERFGEGWTAFATAAQEARDLRTLQRAFTMGRLAYEAAPLPASFHETFVEYRRSSRRDGKSRLGAYADSNEKEFFAELTAAYFDVGFEDGKYNDLRKLMTERPELAQLMFRVYGPAPSSRGK